jgi:ferredoxin-type protein NapG
LSKDPIDRRDFFRHGLRNLARTVADSVESMRPGSLSGPLGGNSTRPLAPGQSGRPLVPGQQVEYSTSLDDRPHLRIRPPGALAEAEFLEACTRCDACFDACPIEAIVRVPDGRVDGGTPHLQTETTACSICKGLACTQVCEPGALLPLHRPREINMGLAVFDTELCLAYKGQFCDACIAICPTQPGAITQINGAPSLVPDFCTGCGLCEQFCPTWPKAVRVENSERTSFHAELETAAEKAHDPEADTIEDGEPQSDRTTSEDRVQKTMSQKPNRRVEPAPEPEVQELAPPSTVPRPLAAGLLWAGPIFAMVGILGWARIIMMAPLDQATEFRFGPLAIDLLLLVLFIAPHSIMARGIGRRWLNKPLGPCGERPLYVFVAGITLTLLAVYWRTTGPVLWSIDGFAGVIVRSAQGLGLLLAVWSAFVVGGAHLLGLPHLRALASGRNVPANEFVALPPYSVLRQPLNFGILVALICMPEVTLDRFLLGILTAAWILFVAPYEERDAEMVFGEGYTVYRDRTPRWLPRRHKPEE